MEPTNSATENATRLSGEHQSQWWMVVDGETTGPHNEADISTRIVEKQLARQTPACPVEQQGWRRLDGWPQFAGLFDSPDSQQLRGRTLRRPDLWNGRLPFFARLLCLYSLLVQPMLSLLYIVGDMASGGIAAQSQEQFDRVFYPVSDYLQQIFLAVLFVVAGFCLSVLHKQARYLVPTALAISIARGVAAFIAVPVALVYSATLPIDLVEANEPIGLATMLICCFGLPLFLTAFCFEIYSLVWWLRHVSTLRLDEPSESQV